MYNNQYLGLALITLAPLFCITPLVLATTTTIDCGSATDSNFTGGQAFTAVPLTPPGTLDLTLRYGSQFSYSIPAANVPYVITFHFLEPCGAAGGCSGAVTGPGQRLFSVAVNDQPLLPTLDIYALAGGALIPITRSVIAVGADQTLNIRFTATVRTAVVSAIDFTPLFQPSASTRQIIWYEYIAERQPDGSYVFPGPPLGALVSVVWQGPTVWRNGIRQPPNPNPSYSIASIANTTCSQPPCGITPNEPVQIVPNPPWDPTDSVLAEYWIVANGGPTVGSPSVPVQ